MFLAGIGGMMINVPQDWSKMPEPMPKGDTKTSGGKENVKPKAKAKSKQPTGKDTLGSKSTLKAWLES